MLITAVYIIAETLQFYFYCFIRRRTITRCFFEGKNGGLHTNGVKLNVGHIAKISKPMPHFCRYSNIGEWSLDVYEGVGDIAA